METAYSIYVVPDETTDRSACYRAYHPELQGCMSHGATVAEAILGLHAARELYLNTLRELGQPIPPIPESETVVIWENFSVTQPVRGVPPSAASLPTTELTARH
jgi:predicted RNase H-like HicB family nuclease